MGMLKSYDNVCGTTVIVSHASIAALEVNSNKEVLPVCFFP